MKHLKRTLFRSVLAGVLLPAFAFTTVFAGAPTQAEAARDRTDCRVVSFHASKEGDSGIPEELEFMRETLEEDAFAAYKSFSLVQEKTLKLKLGRPAKEAKFRSGHRVTLALLDVQETKLKLHLTLFGRDGTNVLGSTDYSIEDNGMFMLGAGRHEVNGRAGKLFFVVNCQLSE